MKRFSERGIEITCPSRWVPSMAFQVSVKEHQGMHIYGKDINTAYVSSMGGKSLRSPTNRALFDAGLHCENKPSADSLVPRD